MTRPAAAAKVAIETAPDAGDAAARLPGRLWSENLPREHGFEPLRVEGKLPPELRGTLFCNGPGLYEQFGRRYQHAFEADGAVSAVRVAGGSAWGAARVTESAGLREERAAGRVRHGMRAPWPRRFVDGLRGRSKNTANTSVLLWQGRLFALMEAGRPTEIDPGDLTTLGETDLDGVVLAMFSAHPHRVASRRTTYNFGLEYGRKSRLHLYALPDEGPARRLGAVELPGPPMLHDFIATETHLVFFLSPVRVNVPRALLQLGGFEQLFRWQPELGTEVICVPIDQPDRPVRFTVEPFYQWHFANAFARGGQELVVDYVRYPDFRSFSDIGAFSTGRAPAALSDGRWHRATIDLGARTLRSEMVFERSCDFPKVAPAVEGSPHRHAWMMLGDLQALGRLDTRTGALVTHELPSTERATEPVFVPRPGAATGEDDGHVLSLCHDARQDRAFLAVYDARRLPDGPVAKVWFDHQIPITFHGAWAPA